MVHIKNSFKNNGRRTCIDILQRLYINGQKTYEEMGSITNHQRNANQSHSEISSHTYLDQFSSVQSLSRVWFFVTPWTAALQASLSITNSQSAPKPMSIESAMPPNHLILCHLLLLLPSIFPSIGVFSNESVLHIRWPKYQSFSFSFQWIFRTDFL